MNQLTSEFPYPTAEELFREQMDAPLVSMVLGERKQQLSFYRTGIPEFNNDDKNLFRECVEQLSTALKSSGATRHRLLKTLAGQTDL